MAKWIMAERLEGSAVSPINLQGSFSINTTKYTLKLTDTNLSWKRNDTENEDGTEIPVMDIVSVKPEASETGKTDFWTLCYAQRMKKNLLRKATVMFSGEPNDCQEWRNKIQQLLDAVEQRPKRSLVIINPIGGWKTGEKNYKSKVAPLFAEAKIYTDVRVTEKANHPKELLATYDLTTIDSIISVGGDGTYQEIVNGLMSRIVKDSNGNLNDPNMEIPCIDVPIGIIPCGTGNGIAKFSYGCPDVETAALSIIIVAMIQGLIYNTPRPITLNIKYKAYKPIELEQENGTTAPDTADEHGGTGEKGQQWVTVEKEFVGPISFGMNADGPKDDALRSLTLVGIKPCTRMQLLKLIFKMTTGNMTSDLDYVERYTGTEYTIKVVNPSDPDTHNGCVEHHVNVDGEVLKLRKPEYTVRLFPRKIQLFANVPEDYFITIQKS